MLLLRAAARRGPRTQQRTFVVAARKQPQQARAYSSPKPPHLTSKTLPRGRIGFVNGIRQLQKKSLLNGVDDRPTLSELLPPDASITDVDKEHIKNLPRFTTRRGRGGFIVRVRDGLRPRRQKITEGIGARRLYHHFAWKTIELSGLRHGADADLPTRPTRAARGLPAACQSRPRRAVSAEEHEAYTGFFTRPVGGPLCFKGRCCVIGGHERIVEARARLDCSWAC